MTVHCAYVNLVGVHLLHLFLQLILRTEGLVADVDVIFQSERELSMLKVVLLN